MKKLIISILLLLFVSACSVQNPAVPDLPKMDDDPGNWDMENVYLGEEG